MSARLMTTSPVDGRIYVERNLADRVRGWWPGSGQAAGAGFATAGLELGGQYPAYVRADADLAHAVESLTDGAFFNAGQSCCGIKRIYVNAPLFDRFVEAMVDLTHKYRLGSPLEPQTTLGPMVRTGAADAVRAQVDAAVARGARQLIDKKDFPMDQAGTPYLAPKVRINVDHSYDIMREETFGPAVGIVRVASDEEAVRLMNDSAFGLTGSHLFCRSDAGPKSAVMRSEKRAGSWK